MSLFFYVISNWIFYFYINIICLDFILPWFDNILLDFRLTDTFFMILFTVSEMFVISFLNELSFA